jgi:5-methylcytosine-specific restriction endonuclease McrA
MKLEKFIKATKGMSYKERALLWLKANLGKPVTSQELAQIPGKNEKPISHNIRRIFELRDEEGYEIVNWRDNKSTGLTLKVNEWVLLKKTPNRLKIRPRGVNKRIAFEVFSRDDYQCQICGRTKDDDDPFRPGHKITLHIGHIRPHKQKKSESLRKAELTSKDFITMCNVCNEGAKNKKIKIVKLVDRVRKAPREEQFKIYRFLRKKFVG